MNDPEFLQSVLSTLPGVDPTSEDVQRAMGNLTQPKDSDKKEDKDSKKWFNQFMSPYVFV